MGKETNSVWTGVLVLILAFFMIGNAMKSSLSTEDHIYIEGTVINAEKYAGPKRTTRLSFSIENPKYKGKVFDTYPIIQTLDSGTNIFDYFKAQTTIGFHANKTELSDIKVKIYSLTYNGEVIVPLEDKWRFKYWNLSIGIFLLIGSFFIFKNS